MCGIVGSFNIEWIKDPISSVIHRGPDYNNKFKTGNLFLGHTRLSIIDTSHLGNQPMMSTDKNWIIIFNGEIYNHHEIRSELKEKYKQDFISQSDTETLLYGWVHFGKKILDKLNGIFSFAIYNKIDNRLTIVRDPFGVKPLYFYEDQKGFAFSSELKSFLQIKNFNCQINFKGLRNYLSFLWSPGEDTMYENVLKILPGHLVDVNLTNYKISFSQYFDNKKIPKYDYSLNENEWLDLIDNKLNNAVKRQMMSDVPVGFFLSGGLDSSLLVAIAKKNFPYKKFECFTIKTKTSNGKEGFADDLPYARKVANFLNVNLNEVEIGKINISDFDNMIYNLDEPQADLAPINVKLISKKARDLGIKVLISGTGGDDLFSGYRRHKAIKVEKYINIFPQFILKIIRKLILKLPSKKPIYRRLKKLTRDWHLNPSIRLFGYFNWLPNNNFINKLLLKPNINHDDYDYFRKIIKENHGSNLKKILMLEQNTFLIDHNLNYTDKMSMVKGVECRVPFLDLEVVKLSRKIPDKFLIKNNISKYILKKVAERYLPKEVIYRSKTGFGSPVRDMIDNELKHIKIKYLNKNIISKQEIFNFAEIDKMIQSHNQGSEDFGYNILSLMAIQSWLNQFKFKIKFND